MVDDFDYYFDCYCCCVDFDQWWDYESDQVNFVDIVESWKDQVHYYYYYYLKKQQEKQEEQSAVSPQAPPTNATLLQ